MDTDLYVQIPANSMEEPQSQLIRNFDDADTKRLRSISNQSWFSNLSDQERTNSPRSTELTYRLSLGLDQQRKIRIEEGSALCLELENNLHRMQRLQALLNEEEKRETEEMESDAARSVSTLLDDVVKTESSKDKPRTRFFFKSNPSITKCGRRMQTWT